MEVVGGERQRLGRLLGRRGALAEHGVEVLRDLGFDLAAEGTEQKTQLGFEVEVVGRHDQAARHA